MKTIEAGDYSLRMDRMRLQAVKKQGCIQAKKCLLWLMVYMLQAIIYSA